MKPILAVAVITCLFVMGLAQTQTPQTDCSTRYSQITSCLSRSATGDDGSFCNECRSTLIDYYQDCANGIGIEAIQQSELN